MIKFIKLLIVISLFLLLLVGCNFSQKDEPHLQSDCYYSSQIAYDYVFKVDSDWLLKKQEPYYHFIKDDMDLFIFKKDIDNQKYDMGTQSEVYPQLFSDAQFEDIKFNELIVESSQTDYIDELKFKYNIGEYKQIQYQAIYFLSENVVPSVSGKVVANCMLITYKDTSKREVRNELISLEKSIYYE